MDLQPGLMLIHAGPFDPHPAVAQVQDPKRLAFDSHKRELIFSEYVTVMAPTVSLRDFFHNVTEPRSQEAVLHLKAEI